MPLSSTEPVLKMSATEPIEDHHYDEDRGRMERRPSYESEFAVCGGAEKAASP